MYVLDKCWFILLFSLNGLCAQILKAQKILFSITDEHHEAVYIVSPKWYTFTD